MKKTILLKEQREQKVQAMEAILEIARTEAGEGVEMRDLTQDEATRFDAITTEIAALDNQIERAEKIEAHDIRMAQMKGLKVNNNPVRDTQENLFEKFSFQRAIRVAAGIEPMDGPEAEIHQMAVNEGKETGRIIEGFGIPHALGTRGAYVTSTANAAGDLVKEVYRPLNMGLIPKLQLENLGARVTSNAGKIVTIKTGYVTAEWEGEITDAAEKQTTFTKATYTPIRLGGYSPISRAMLLQDGYGVEERIKTILQNGIRIALDTAGINGTGGGTEPLGILGWSGIGNVALGADGGLPELIDMLNLEAAIDTAFADIEGLKFLTTPGVKAYLKSKAVDEGSGRMIWDRDGIIGYPGFTTTLVPSNLTKGGATTKCHAAILGDFTKLEIAQFGGFDLLVDPYTDAKKTVVNIWLNSWWNTIIDYPESFAAIKDIDLTLIAPH